MNAPASLQLPAAIGAPYGGGFLYGAYMHNGEPRILILAPKAEGEFRDVRWNKSYDHVELAHSYYDGQSNTLAMASAGSELAQKVRALTIGGHADWFLPAVDQIEIAYRALKPSTRQNDCWARSGINLSAVPPRWPYTPDFPKQTELEIFREGGAEAFEVDDWYWTSTQHPGTSGYAFVQDFGDGGQNYVRKDDRYMGRAVRSESI